MFGVSPLTVMLLALAYLLVVCVFNVLAAKRSAEIAVHDRVRESKALRGRYLAAVRSKPAK